MTIVVLIVMWFSGEMLLVKLRNYRILNGCLLQENFSNIPNMKRHSIIKCVSVPSK
jgi:hypothetical protein